MQEIDFDTVEPITIDVKVSGQWYVLREGSGDAVAKFKNKLMKCARTMPDGKQTFDGLGDMEAYLISLCLYETEGGQKGVIKVDKSKKDPVEVLVSEFKIRSWPGRVQKELFKKAKEITPIEDEEATIEGMEKQIAELQSRIDTLKANKDNPKN